MWSIIGQRLKSCSHVWYFHKIIIGIQFSALNCHPLNLYHCISKWLYSPYHTAAWNRFKKKLKFFKELLRQWLLSETFPRSRKMCQLIRFPNSCEWEKEGGKEVAGAERSIQCAYQELICPCVEVRKGLSLNVSKIEVQNSVSQPSRPSLGHKRGYSAQCVVRWNCHPCQCQSYILEQ